MVAVGIMAVILTISFPFFVREKHKDSMRKAVEDVQELCREARNRAVLNGQPMELRINPASKTFSVAAGTAPVATTDGSPAPDAAGDTSTLTRKLSDHIIIEFIGINLEPDLHLAEQCGAMFNQNGTSDELVIVLRSDQGEVRQITIDPVTGVPDVEVKR
jgi:Tfp pilus assembly protein FimT